MHFFSVEDRRYCFDEATGNCFLVDEVAEKALCVFESEGREYNSDALSRELELAGYDVRTIEEALDDVDEFRQLEKRNYITDDVPRTLRSIELHVAHVCNLGCDYCFAGKGNYGTQSLLMKEEVAYAAVDYLVHNSSKNDVLTIVFFGGEPMLNEPLIWKTVDYAESAHPKRRFTYSITTNGTLLNDRAIEAFKEHGFSILVSLDGVGCKHDESRPYKNGRGSFADIERNVRLYSKRASLGARATLTKNNCSLLDDYASFKDMGFKKIYFSPVSTFDERIMLDENALEKIRHDLIELSNDYLEQIKQGDKPLLGTLKNVVDLILERRLSVVGCGAGRRFISITPEGDVYPCHRFVGMDWFKMGNILGGVDEQSYSVNWAQTVDKRTDCSSCWARSFCGGGCSWEAADETGYLDESRHPTSCEYKRMCLEIALDLISRSENLG